MAAKAAKKKTTSAEKQPTIRYIEGEPSSKPAWYVNSIELQMGLFDIQIRMNRVIGADAGKNQVSVINQGTLVMSPQHAASLAEILVRNLKDYEAEYGKLPGREGPSS